MTTERLATLACQRGKKREQCVCAPCSTRREIFGDNIPCQLQEMRREALIRGEIVSLKEKTKDEFK
jgi:hypothetical protein